MNENFYERHPILTIVFAIAAFIACCGTIAVITDVASTAYNTQVTQPLRRINQNHDADWQRAQTQLVIDAYTGFQQAHDAMPNDLAALKQFVKDNPKPWDVIQSQQYAQFLGAYNDDFKAEVHFAQAFNAIYNSPDQHPSPWPASVPLAPLTPDAQEQVNKSPFRPGAPLSWFPLHPSTSLKASPFGRRAGALLSTQEDYHA